MIRATTAPALDPTRFIDHHFRIKTVDWSLYEISRPNIKGVVRLLGMPTNIFEVPEGDLPAGAPRPMIAISVQGIVGFLNEGRKGAPGMPVSPQELLTAKKEDVTGYVIPRNEPFNEFIVPRKGKPSLLVRTKTVLLKAEVLADRYGPAGEPLIWINHNTNHSVSEGSNAELYSE